MFVSSVCPEGALASVYVSWYVISTAINFYTYNWIGGRDSTKKTLTARERGLEMLV